MKNQKHTKSEKKLHKIEWILAIYLILSVVADQITSLVYAEEYSILWYCSLSAVLLAIGCIRRSTYIPGIVFTISLVAQTPWILDFFLEFFGLGFGRNAILIQYGWPLLLTSTNLHASLIPISLFLVLKRGYPKSTVFWSLAYGILLLTASFFLTEPTANVNCVFNSCDEDIYLLESRFSYVDHFLYKSLFFWIFWVTVSYGVIRGVRNLHRFQKRKRKP